MKFAKELEQDAVPEWRIKYLNYKAGKKHVKAVARAINRVNVTPRTPSKTPKTPVRRTPTFFQTSSPHGGDAGEAFSERINTAYSDPEPSGERHNGHSATNSQPIASTRNREDESLTGEGNKLQYGSFVDTPPAGGSPPTADDDHAMDFELPSPAIRDPPQPSEPVRPTGALRNSISRLSIQRRASPTNVPALPHANTYTSSYPLETRATVGANTSSPRADLRRIFSHASGPRRDGSRAGINMQSFDLVREREFEFYDFMDSELAKVETFYKLKEEQAGQRLSLLREQLHEMRNRRIQEMADEQHAEDHVDHERFDSHDKSNGWVQPIKAKIFPPGPNSKALQNMPRTPHMAARRNGQAGQDYTRRPDDDDVSYRTAKHKLKLALQEFYRGLELLKSYALMNRTAFRKINKKFDKAVNARPPMRFMNEKVNKAWFVNSDVLEGHIKTVEDLYARYFERGNRKLAVGKLRSLSKKAMDESGSSFVNGVLIGTGAVFSIQGVIYGAELLFNDDPILRLHTSYLMQLYGGYFLMLTLFSLFCMNCFIWTKNKINYPFIFELDQRSQLDWRRLAAFPSFFLLLLGVCMWANFSRYGAEWMYRYYPVALIGVTAAVLFLPAPVVAYKSRRWFAYSHWRLLLAGLYPVEFRDFFLGDMYCSLTYAMANIEVFFCLYGHDWKNPTQCNSSHSRVLGFLSTVPPIWRLFQCLRRYRDTRNVFPHLVNGGKYIMTILSAVVLSIYRIHNSRTNLAIYIAVSAINSVYASIWDLFMDFSLLQPHSRHLFLRDVLALKNRWPYYFIMIIDPILRFSWIFYAIFTHDTQHSTTASFFVSLTEVVRRGMWSLFRVENEHCANVSQYKASRDVPLPYRIEPLIGHASAESIPILLSEDDRHRQEQGVSTSSSTAVASTLGALRKRAESSGARTFSRIMAEAHKQDFVKKRKPADQVIEQAQHHGVLSDDDEDDDDTASMHAARDERAYGRSSRGEV